MHCRVKKRRIIIICKEFKFEAGRVVAALNRKCTYPQIPTCHSDPFFDGINAEKIEVIFHSNNLTDERDIGAIILIYLQCKEEQEVIRVIEVLLKNPYVIFAEPDYFIGTHIIPNDPYFRYLWGMENINSPSAWDYTTGSRSVVVGVADSGIDYNHPDITGNMWVALDQNGNPADSCGNSLDETGHGTHVAGTIGAVGNNFIGVTGVCWNIRLASLKIGNAFFNLAAAIRAIDYANENNIPILNNSWGERFDSSLLRFAIDHYNGLFIASAGNDGTNNDIFPVYPACYDSRNIIAVAATEPNGKLASFSNYGTASTDIAAPGLYILSTDINGGYSYMSGTSMAAPHVAGAAALLKALRPDFTALDMKNIILSSVNRQPDLFNKVLSGGALNIYRMVEMAIRS